MTENGHAAMVLQVVPLNSPTFFTPALLGLEKSIDELVESTGRLSSGNRILEIGDDVGSFTLAKRLQSERVALKQASQNAAEADSLLQVAAGGLEQINELLDGLQTIAAQANTTSLSAGERNFLQQQFTAHLDEIDRIAASTSFNGRNLLDGTLADEDFQVGTDPTDIINVAIDSVTADDIFEGDIPDVSSQANAAAAEDAIADADVIVETLISTVGALQGRFQSAGNNISVRSAGIDHAHSELSDTDIPQESIDFSLTKLRLNVATAAIAQAQHLQSNLLGVLKFDDRKN